jgi:hypothetical protein
MNILAHYTTQRTIKKNVKNKEGFLLKQLSQLKQALRLVLIEIVK